VKREIIINNMVADINWVRFAAIILLGLWEGYWLIMAQIAKKEKPKSKPLTPKSLIEFTIHFLLGMILVVQLLGLKILSFPDNNLVQITGLLILVAGIAIAVSARIVLASNWTEAAEYQIKKGHELVITGIYRYIRHPIYFGLMVVYTGGLIVSQTYLFIPFFFILFYFAYSRGKREEKILMARFGGKYVDYLKSSKMLIPFIF
jgi:protein-S-isoprenylcysteine O-methyltransferase Ste14